MTAHFDPRPGAVVFVEAPYQVFRSAPPVVGPHPFVAPLDTPPVQGLFALAEAWHRLRYQLRRAEGRHKELVALVGGHLRGGAWATEQLKVHLEVYGK